MQEELKEIYEDLEMALAGIISGKCKSEAVIHIEEAMGKLVLVGLEKEEDV